MTTPHRRVWFLNLDAERELARPTRPPRLDHGRFTDPLIGTLVPNGDEVAQPGVDYTGYRAMAWCPTAGIRALVLRAGAAFSADTPPPELIARVVGRDFIARERGLALPGATYVDRAEDLEQALAIESPTERLLLRHRYGFAGTMRRTCARGAPAPADRAFLAKALARGGVLIEPLVHVLCDLAVHGHVGPSLVLGRPTEAVVNAGGVWVASRLRSDLQEDVLRALTAEARGCGESLARAGYRGPFGVDAFLYDHQGHARLAARCELNARYTMGWAVGMGGLRPDLAENSPASTTADASLRGKKQSSGP